MKPFIILTFFLTFIFSLKANAQIVAVFFDQKLPQHEFAAGDIKLALEARNFTVEYKELSSFKNTDKQPKIVIALASNTQVAAMLKKQGGNELPALEEQAYALRTTNSSQKTYWILGGDVNGAMYGALQLAENINFNGLSESYNLEESAYMKKRGIKFNIPFDEKSPTYFYGFGGTSHINALEHVWDITFWKTWFDEMARHRFNVLSLWSPHPFTSMLDMTEEGYGDVKIENVQYNDYFKAMSMDEKIRFWQEVMAYGRSRGFDIYFFTWNIFLSTAEDKYGMTRDPKNSVTKDYMKASMNKFLETYPDLTGFGVTAGEGFPHDFENKVGWLWDTYGQGMMKYAKAHPERDLVFIHREHQTGAEDVLADFEPLNELPNVRVDMSFKYSKAHCHTTTSPNFMSQSFVDGLIDNEVKTWLELRNDDFYFLHWGEPQFIRDYVNGFLKEDLLAGAFFGADGWVFTRVFTSRNPYYKDNNALEIQKHWYMRKLWGRLMYNPATSDELFQNHLTLKYPEVSSSILFDAWSKASKAIQLSNEQVSGRNWKLDFQWYPENWTSKDGLRTLEQTRLAVPMDGSNLCSLSETANGNCEGKVSAWTTIEQIDLLANEALKILAKTDPKSNTELMLNMRDLEAMANLSLYSANKFRAAIYLEEGKENKARNSIGKAYCYWKTYTNMMNALYYPVNLQRNYNFAEEGWHIMDSETLKDYLGAGGSREPNCAKNYPWISITSPVNNSYFMEPADLNFTVDVEYGNTAIDKVEFYSNGELAGTDITAPYGIELSGLKADRYTLEANVFDEQGGEDSNSITFDVYDTSHYNKLPWIENFNLSNGTTADNGLTSWTAERSGGKMLVQNNRVVINDSGSEGILKTGILDISDGPVNVVLELDAEGGLDEGGDYVKLFKRVDGGEEVLIGEQSGKLNETTIAEENITGKSLELIIKAQVSHESEFYYLNKLSVTGSSAKEKTSVEEKTELRCQNISAVNFTCTSIDGYTDAKTDHKAGLDILQIPKRGAWAAAQYVYPGPDINAYFKLNTMQETDGESSYKLSINGEALGEVTNDRIHGTTISDYTIQSHLMNETPIKLKKGDVIQVSFNNATNGLVPEGDLTATSRGRWASIDICKND